MPNHIFALDPPYDAFVKYRTNKFLRRARTIVRIRSLQSYAAFPEKLVSEEKQIALLVGIGSTDSSLVIRNLQFDCIYEIINETEYTSAIKTTLNWISSFLLCFPLSTRRRFPRYATNEANQKSNELDEYVYPAKTMRNWKNGQKYFHRQEWNRIFSYAKKQAIDSLYLLENEADVRRPRASLRTIAQLL